MSKIAVAGNASGTGTLTIAAPNTNSDQTITLPDATGSFVTADGSGNITIASGTANGVTYLNSSKVLTSGSALTFSGTNLSGTGQATFTGFKANGSTISSGASQITVDQVSSTLSRILAWGPDASTVGLLDFTTYSSNAAVTGASMRLTSTGLGIGTSSPQTLLEASQTGVGSVVIPIVAANQDTSSTGTGAGIGFVVDGVNNVIGAQVAGIRTGAAYHQSALAMYTRDSAGGGLLERMRIDSAGRLGIGTSSPGNYSSAANNLVIAGTGQRGMTIATTNGSQTSIFFADADSGTGEYAGAINYFHSDDHIEFLTASAEKMRIDSAGNLGLGVTPSAWRTATKGFQIGVQGFVSGNTANQGTRIGTNAYVNSSGAETYIATDSASYYQQFQGSHTWLSAPSGTAGAAISFTQAMTLTAAGNLALGATSSTVRLLVVTSGDTPTVLESTTGNSYVLVRNSGGTAGVASTGNNLVLFTSSSGTERVRIDSSGNVGIGTSSPTRQLEVSKAGAAYIRAVDTVNSVNIDILATSSGGWIGPQSNHSLNFQTNNIERARIDTSGNLLVGTTDTGGKLLIAKATVPTTYSKNTAYLQVGATEETLNGFHLITFGYTTSAATFQPAFIGYTETNNSGYAAGALIFGTRSAVTDTAPTERVRIDSAGRVTMPYQPAFVAKFSVTKTNAIGTPILFNAVGYNIGSHYNGSTGIFTAPVAGRYQFNVMALRRSGGSGYLNLKVYINGATQSGTYGDIYTNDLTGEIGISGSWVVNLAANDQFAVVYGSASIVEFYASETAMSGILIG